MSKKFSILCVLAFLFVSSVFGQDDESRQQSGLPTYIGVRPGNTAMGLVDATLSGTVTVQGLNEARPHTITVSVLVNGVTFARTNSKNRGGFNFSGIPRSGVTLVVDIDGQEVHRQSMATLNGPPLGNRADLIVTAAKMEIAERTGAGVVKLADSYPRSEEGNRLLERALAGIKAKKFDDAEKVLRQIIRDDEKDYVAHTELGNVLFLKSKYADAESSYKVALALKPDFLPALLNLGKLYLEQKQFDNSIEMLEKAVAAEPDNADVNHYLGEAYLQNKKGSKAVVYLNKAIELDPAGKAELHLRLAQLYNAANLKDRAVREYRLFLEKVPKYPERDKLEKYIKDNSTN